MKFRSTWLSRTCKRAVLGSSEFAARRGWSLATYNPALFAFYHVVSRESAPGVVAAVADTFPHAQSYLDVGAGSGAFSAEARRRGKYVVACEHSPFGRAFARAGRRRIPSPWYESNAIVSRANGAGKGPMAV
jgi:SAM-dependent methyltransferase